MEPSRDQFFDPADFDTLHNVEPGKHFYQFYKSKEDYLRVLTPFFKTGLEKGDACVWLVSNMIGVDSVRAHLDKVIEDLADFEKFGQLQILSAEDWYLKQGNFSEEQALCNMNQFVTEKLKEGYRCVRGSGDAGAIPHSQWPLVHDYEEKTDQIIRKLPIIGLCAYPILECSISDTRMVIENHESVLVGRM